MRIVRLVTVVGALAALLLAAAPVAAADVTPEEAIAELDRARALIDESLELYEAGRFEEAYTAARNAYLDHFEYVEIPLRVRDEGLTLALEEDFATFRNLVRAGAPESEVEAVASELRSGLDDVERALASPGLAAPVLAMVYAFTILFREGFEAVLVVAVILGYLEASRNRAYRGPILQGVGAAVLASLVVFVLATAVLRLAPVQRELLEAGTALLAVGVLFYVSFWLISRLDHRRWLEFMRARVSAAAATGSGAALFAVGFTAVFREGLETVLFYQALLSFARGLEPWVALGMAAAAGVLAGVAYLVLRAGQRIPVKTVLGTAVVVIMSLSVAFAGNALRALQSAAVVPVTFLESVPRLPIFLAELTGWYPTLETIAAQAALTLVYVLGAAWVFVVAPRRARRSAEAGVRA
ncbi:MAG TPA: FTR1 family protein [Candidatus Limnocylindrales bacterium]|nr:FTR1 family protein [Candidatus Limnocylindrales bacterium]